MEVLKSPQISPRTGVGKHHSFPQADAMALLLNHGPNVENDGHPLRRQ